MDLAADVGTLYAPERRGEAMGGRDRFRARDRGTRTGTATSARRLVNLQELYRRLAEKAVGPKKSGDSLALDLGDEPFIRGLAAERSMRPVVVIVLLPLFQLLVEQLNIVADPITVEELIELLVVDTMGPFDLPVEVRRPGTDVDVPNVAVYQVPMEA